MSKGRNGAAQISEVPVAVIGAGPAGIALSARLQTLGVEHIVLEAERVGDTWRRIPTQLRLLNDWWLCSLTYRDAIRYWPFRRMHAGDLLEHVLKLAQRHAVPVREHCAVSMVERHDAGFKLHISKGDAILARIVVCASGYFKKPFRPELPNDGSVPALHTSEIADHSECYRWGSDGKRVLIVGRRISAGQLLELVSSTGSEVHLSAKGPIDFSREVWWRPAYERLYSIYEPLRLLLEPERQGNSYPAMRGGETRRLIESGQVPLHPPPAAIREGKVEFNDGTWDHFDLLIYATGYSPCLDYLRPLSEGFEGFTIHEVKSLEHHRVPHLYFLGLDNARSFRSRYLRGIRADARWLARRINKHLKSVTQT